MPLHRIGVFYIKRLLAFIAAVSAAAALSCCTSLHGEPTPPTLSFVNSHCTAEYNGSSYELCVTHMPEGMTEIRFTQPETMRGLSYTFTADGCKISFGDLSFRSDRSHLQGKALPQLINELLSSNADNLHYESTQREDGSQSLSRYSGEHNGMLFSVVCSSENGDLREITSSEQKLRLVFE